MTAGRLLRAMGVVLTLAGIAGLGAGPFAADVAYAKGKGGEGKGGGNGGGKGADKGGNNGNGAAAKPDRGGKQARVGNGRGKPERGTSKGFGNKLEQRLNTFFGGKKSRRQASRAAPKSGYEKAEHPSRGRIASELKGLNAAHASQTALMNAAPNSMPGKLYSYQQAVLDFDDAKMDLTEAQDELERVLSLDPSAEEFQPTEDEEAQGITAQDKYDAAVADAEMGVSDAEDALVNTDQDAADQAVDDAQDELDRLAGLTPDDDEFQPSEEEAAEGITAEDKYDAAVAGAQSDLDEAIETAENVLTDPDDALDTLTDGRELSPEALAELHDLLGLVSPEEEDGEESADFMEVAPGDTPLAAPVDES